jgi:hypothetical protein
MLQDRRELTKDRPQLRYPLQPTLAQQRLTQMAVAVWG